MKAEIKFFFLGLFAIISTQAWSQDTLRIVFNDQAVKDAYINIVNDEPYGTSQGLVASVWTHYGEFGTGRSLFGFDFSEMRQHFVIIDARLNLFHNPTSSHVGHSNLGGDNTGMIFRITEPWNENTLTWDNQPATTNTNAIFIPAPATEDADFLNIDITPIIKDMIRHPESSDGFMIKLFSEDTLYRSLVFASSEHPDAGLHPSIEITYVVDLPPDTLYPLRPGIETGKDATVTSLGSPLRDDDQSLVASVWELDEGWNVARSYLHFDLTPFISPAIITKAELSLFHDPMSSTIGHVTGGGSNELVISRVTEDWDEDQITWTNQPSISAENQVVVSSSNIANQDYLDMDVTNLVTDMINHHGESFGFTFQLNDETIETYNRNVVFASSNHNMPELRPRLVIYTKNSTGYNESQDLPAQALIYPNPGRGIFKVKISDNLNPVKYCVTDSFGHVIAVGTVSESEFTLDLTLQPSGIYFLSLVANDVLMTRKIMKY